jgi:hypothetical protein
VDYRIRGILEERVDALLKPHHVATWVAGFQRMKPYLQSEEDAYLGFVLGQLFDLYSNLMSTSLLRTTHPQTPDRAVISEFAKSQEGQIKAFVQWMLEKVPQIKSKIQFSEYLQP